MPIRVSPHRFAFRLELGLARLIYPSANNAPVGSIIIGSSTPSQYLECPCEMLGHGPTRDILN